MAGEELCQDCGARVASLKMKRHIMVNHDKEEKTCTKCKKLCVGKKSFYNHMRSHGSQEKCKFCSADILRSKISQHERGCTKNPNIKAIKCEICPFESAFKYKVQSHHDSVHVDVKPDLKERKKKTEELSCSLPVGASPFISYLRSIRELHIICITSEFTEAGWKMALFNFEQHFFSSL